MCLPTDTPVEHPKSQDIISFLLPLIHLHRRKHAIDCDPASIKPPPFFVGVSGIQGCGKTTLTRELHELLTRPPYSLRVLGFSLDDLYLPHCELRTLADKHAQNPFLRQRGLPGTHDVHLAESFLGHLSRQGSDMDAVVRVPAYDKGMNAGEGDRVDEKLWREEKGPWDIIVFEGWMVGFTPLGRAEMERRWLESKKTGQGALGRYKLQDLLWLDEQLQRYQDLWSKVEALIHLDANDLAYVYEWRIEQEHSLLTQKGSGMTDAQVRAFVDNFIPCYELYLPGLREKCTYAEFDAETWVTELDRDAGGGGVKREYAQLRFVVRQDRKTVKTEVCKGRN